MARSVSKDKDLPNKFWAEAFYTDVYLHSQLPTKVIFKRRPLKAWSSHRHLYVTWKYLNVYVTSMCLVKSNTNCIINLKKEFFLATVHSPKDIGFINHKLINFKSAEMLYLTKILLGIGSIMLLTKSMLWRKQLILTSHSSSSTITIFSRRSVKRWIASKLINQIMGL